MINALQPPFVDFDSLSEDERTREVFAHYGLAMYESQVLEHGIANALMILEFLPQATKFKNFEEWSKSFDRVLDAELERTFGGLVTRLKDHEYLPRELLASLTKAKDVRNTWLIHLFVTTLNASCSLTAKDK